MRVVDSEIGEASEITKRLGEGVGILWGKPVEGFKRRKDVTLFTFFKRSHLGCIMRRGAPLVHPPSIEGCTRGIRLGSKKQ